MKSSYDFSRIHVNHDEAGRLDVQAALFLDHEFETFLGACKPGDRGCLGDFGCGVGTITRAFASFLPEWKVEGYDISGEAIRTASDKGASFSNLSFRQLELGTRAKLPARFDIMFSRFVLGHLLSPQAGIAEMAGHLNPGGKLYVVDIDDGLTLFHPHEAWQEELKGRLEEAALQLGGSRQRGRLLAEYLRGAGLRDVSSQVFIHSTESMGKEMFRQIYEPMAAYYLRSLAALGKVTQNEVERLLKSLAVFLDLTKSRVFLSTWHAWGTTICER